MRARAARICPSPRAYRPFQKAPEKRGLGHPRSAPGPWAWEGWCPMEVRHPAFSAFQPLSAVRFRRGRHRWTRLGRADTPVDISNNQSIQQRQEKQKSSGVNSRRLPRLVQRPGKASVRWKNTGLLQSGFDTVSVARCRPGRHRWTRQDIPNTPDDIPATQMDSPGQEKPKTTMVIWFTSWPLRSHHYAGASGLGRRASAGRTRGYSKVDLNRFRCSI